MLEFIMQIVFNYGSFPAIALYLAYTIARDYRKDLKLIQTAVDTNTTTLEENINEQNEALNELISAITTMQGTMSNQMHDLLMKFIELSMKRRGGDE